MKRPGLTLTELLISMFIMSIVSLVVVNIFIASGKLTKNEQVHIEVGGNAARIYTSMDGPLREGKAVITSVVYNSTTYTTDEDTLVFTVPSIVGGNTTNTTDKIIFYVDTANPNNKIIKRVVIPYVDVSVPANNSTRTGGVSTVATGIRDFYLRYYHSDPTLAQTISATITTSQTSNSRNITNAAILYATFRNHS